MMNHRAILRVITSFRKSQDEIRKIHGYGGPQKRQNRPHCLYVDKKLWSVTCLDNSGA